MLNFISTPQKGRAYYSNGLRKYGNLGSLGLISQDSKILSIMTDIHSLAYGCFKIHIAYINAYTIYIKPIGNIGGEHF